MIDMQLIKQGARSVVSGALEYAPELRYTASGKALCSFRIIEIDSNREAISCEAWEEIGESIIEGDYKSQNLATITGYYKTREHGGKKYRYFVVTTFKYQGPF